MKKLILISALLITGCQTIEEANTKLYAGMDRKSFCRVFYDSALINPCAIYDDTKVEYFPAYKTEIIPSDSTLFEKSDTKMYWYVFKNVNQISPITHHEHFDYAEPGENPGNLVMATDNYQEAYMAATGGRIYGVRKETEKPLGKRQEIFADKIIEAVLEGVVDGTVEALTGIKPSSIGRKLLFETETTCVYENKDGTQETVYKGVKSVRTRTSPHPLGERTRTTTVLEDCD